MAGTWARILTTCSNLAARGQLWRGNISYHTHPAYPDVWRWGWGRCKSVDLNLKQRAIATPFSWNSSRCYFSLSSPRNFPKPIATAVGRISKSSFLLPLGLNPTQSILQSRTVVKCSKLGKMKTVKAVAKRFRRTGSGKLKFWPPGNTHNLLSKSHNFRRRVKKARYVNKTQLKTLNKMLIGNWS